MKHAQAGLLAGGVALGACVSALPGSDVTGKGGGSPATAGAGGASVVAPDASAGFDADATNSGDATDASSNPLLFAAYVGSPFNLAMDLNDLYWVNTNTNFLMKAALDRTGDPTPVAHVRPGIAVVASDGQNVYWADDMSHPATLFALRPGGAPTVLATQPDGIAAIGFNGSEVYWLSSLGAVMKVERDGGTPVSVAGISPASAIALDDQFVYWTGRSGSCLCGAINRIGIGGDGATLLADPPGRALGLAVSSARIYWFDGDSSDLMTVAAAGGAPAPVFAFATHATSFVVDPAGIYWTGPGGTVFAGTPGAANPRTVADSGRSVAFGIISNATDVYWITEGLAGGPDGAIMRAPK